MSREIVERLIGQLGLHPTQRAQMEEYLVPQIERLLAQEREKVREMACKFMCWGCERGHLIVERPEGDDRLTHSDPNGWFECHATLFRQLDLTKDLAASSGEKRKE